MVEVIISFAMLVMAAAMFSNVFLLCGRMTRQATELMEENSRLYEDYYLNQRIETKLTDTGTILFQRIDQNPGGEKTDFFSAERMELYQHTSTEGLRGIIYDVSAGE